MNKEPTSWKDFDWTLQASEPPGLLATEGADEGVDESTVSCWMTRGPITASTALWATALPVPKAIPAHQYKKEVKTRVR